MRAKDSTDPTPYVLGWLFKLYLWLSVAICLIAALAFNLISESESAKLVGAGLILFAGIGIGFARSLRRIENARWWHWRLGALLIAPAVVVVITFG